MEKRSEVLFDLPALLRISELNLRPFATNNSGLTTGDYFFLLTKLIDNIPLAMENLTLITALESDETTLNNLLDTKTLLNATGCAKQAIDIDNTIKTLKRDDKAGAAVAAKKLSDELNRLWARLETSKKAQNPVVPEYSTETEKAKDGSEEALETYSLKMAISILQAREKDRKLRILAVDDAVITLKIVSTILGNDYTVYGMKNPKQVINFLQQVTPELFLLDYRMPEISGFDLVPLIRGIEEHKKTPIIFLTSLGTADTISSAIALGACDFIVKPIQAEVLKEKIAKHIVRKRLV